MVDRIRSDLREIFTQMTATLTALVQRGQRIESLARSAQQLEESALAYGRLGMLDERWHARFCRRCMFDIDFRTFALTVVCGTILFCAVVFLHWLLI
jgi:hypothetical protein